ncbi:hypothetical protein QDR37_00260 [Amnibacterium sp. CER49]|uniref:hypothetical protein n=1 Tax=Amnibacterium sp. CER49 TaxID=3039161 RepID=UPI00244BD1FB|nr:hypothetical protein [Amnibacterium sp. CER49]MDH2442372.1 hypothetical protein [Amnibacterium sp. CER49]
MTDEEQVDRPVWDLHVLALALEALEQDLERTTDPSEHRELTEQIRLLTARIDRLIGVATPGDGGIGRRR